jgi:zinc-binding alcohol dehydrogenase/oxidoreductase
MKALVLTKPNTVEIIEKSKPVPQAGQALVRIKAAALNHRDQWIRIGQYAGIKTSVTLGSDGAGIVEAVAADEDQHWVGREVIINPNQNWGPNPAAQAPDYSILGMPVDGTFAQYIALPLHRLHLKPQHMSWAEAAAVPLGGLTAYRALFTHGELKEDLKVLINGIGGGVAQWAFQFARAAGAKVWVTSSSEEKLAQMQERGSAGGYNYRHEDWTKIAKAETGGFELIIDSAGGNALNNLLNVAASGGRIVFYGATTGIPENLNLRRIFWNQLRLQGSTMGNDEEFAQMVSFIEKQQMKPIMEEPLPFAEIVKAFDMMQEGSQFGKLCVLMD